MAKMQKTPAQLDREIKDALRWGKRGKAHGTHHVSTPSQTQYDQRERIDAHRKLEEVRKAPLAERKEAAATFFDRMKNNPAIVGERVGWMLDGNYGHGEMLMARQILNSPRMNRVAALTHLVGAFEWNSPADMTIKAWKKLTAAEQKALDKSVRAAIKSAESE